MKGELADPPVPLIRAEFQESLQSSISLNVECIRGGGGESASREKDLGDHPSTTYFTDKETEAQRGKATCPSSYLRRTKT